MGSGTGRLRTVTTWSAGRLDRKARVYVAGHRGMVGSALWRALTEAGFTDLVGCSSAELDLLDRRATFDFVGRTRPDVVLDAAARVGGIAANDRYPADFISENLQIQVNLMDAAVAAGVPRLLFLGSSCIYPRDAEQPIKESSLLTGPLEPTNDAYAVAKIAGITAVQAVRRQHGLAWISAMPTNLYGPGDTYDPHVSHVLPALIRRFAEAARDDLPVVTIWGTGRPRREFLHADDLARACLVVLEQYDEPEPINIGSGVDLTIADLAALVAATVGYTGAIATDPTKPDGTPQKLLDNARIRALGWSPTIDLPDGVARAYRSFRAETGVRVGAP